MSYNLSTFFTTSSKIRGGKAVWVKDAGHESRANVLNGATIGNPYKGLGYSFAADLFEYKPFADGLLFRSFLVKTAALIDATTIVLKADGYSHVPETGMLLMKAPNSLKVENYITDTESGEKQKVKITFTAGCSANGNITIGLDGTETAVAVTTAANTAVAVAALVGAATFPNYTVDYTAGNDYVEFTADNYGGRSAATLDVASTGVIGTIEETVAGKSNVIKNVVDYTGQSGKVTAVEYDSANGKFTITVDTAIGVLAPNDILVEAAGTAASTTANVLVANPNTFIEVDTQYMPTDGSYGIENVLHAINVVYDKKAWIERMQPLPAYVLAKNRSYVDGIFWL